MYLSLEQQILQLTKEYKKLLPLLKKKKSYLIKRKSEALQELQVEENIQLNKLSQLEDKLTSTLALIFKQEKIPGEVSVRRLIELRRTNHDLSTLNLANQKLSVVLIEVKHTNETIKTLLQDAQGFIDFMKEQLVGERKMNYERPNVMGKSIRSDYALFDAKA